MLTTTEENSESRANFTIFTLVVGISLFGLLILFSTSSFSAHKSFGDSYYYIKKQSLFILLGFAGLIINTQIHYRVWYTLAWPSYIFSMLLLGMVFIPSIGKEAGGANRWLTFAGFSYQPSDLAKFTTILLISRIFSKETMNQSFNAPNFLKFFLSLLVIAIPIVLISLEPDFGTAFHLFLAAALLLFLTEFPFIFLLTIGISIAPVIYYNIVKVPWRLKRMIAFLNPWEYRYEEGYQLVAAFRSFLEGEFWGKGLGESTIRHRLQARHTDFIFSVVAEDMGLIGGYLLLGAFLWITCHAIILLKKVESSFGRLLGMGILLIFILQVMLHVSVNMGLLPTTGIGLPLMSYGGTSMITYLSMFGVLLNILKK